MHTRKVVFVFVEGEIATEASSIFKPTVGAQLILEVLRRPGEQISDIVSA
jgi:hypothetical protein